MVHENKFSLALIVSIILQSQISLASIKMPFLGNMLLGRTFDYSKSVVGNDIFSNEQRKKANKTKIIVTDYTSSYEMIQNTKSVMDVLDISGQLSLKVMAGAVNVEGKGSYLKSSASDEDSVEVLARAHVKTVSVSLYDDMIPITGWDTGKVTGEHYIRSIIYGGYLIASLKFSAKSGKKKEDIKASIKAEVNAAKGTQVNIEGLFNKLISNQKDLSTLSITYTSSLIPDIIPVDNVTLLKAIQKFPGKVKAQNNGMGVPIEVELRDLGKLKNEQNRFTENSALEYELKNLATNYFDLKLTANLIAKSTENAKLTKEMEDVYGSFNADIWNKSEIFFEAIDNLDLKGAADQLNKARQAYGLSFLPLKYAREFKRMINQYPLEELDEDDRLTTDLVEMDKAVNNSDAKLESLRKLQSGRPSVALAFERESVEDYLITEGPSQSLQDVMACFTAKTNINKRTQTFLSYVTEAKDYIRIESDQGKLSVTVYGMTSKFDINMSDGLWHAWCITWTGRGSPVTAFKDGNKLPTAVTTSNGANSGTASNFLPGGIWVVGQDQKVESISDKEKPGKSFVAGKNFVGKITNVNIFKLSSETFGRQATISKCREPDVYKEEIASWRDFKRGRVGEVKVIDNEEC